MADDVRDRLIKAVEAELDSPGVLAEDIAHALLPVVEAIARERAAEALEEAADAYESYEEQPHINHLAETIYRPGMNLSSIWLGDRAARLRAEESA